jgi:hypothetical protein
LIEKLQSDVLADISAGASDEYFFHRRDNSTAFKIAKGQKSEFLYNFSV